MAKYTPELVKSLCDNIANGFTIVEACESVGISEQTFFRWKVEKSELCELLKEVELQKLQKIKEIAIGSLIKKVSYFEYEEVTTEERETSEGLFRTVKKTKKLMTPSDTALIFALANIDSEKWKRADKQVFEVKKDVDYTTELSDDQVQKIADQIQNNG